MKKYLSEIIISAIQLLIFYICPIFIDPIKFSTVILIMVLITLTLSFLIGFLSKSIIKYFYPLYTAIIFIPSIFIFYNSTTFIYTLWFLIVAIAGFVLGWLVSLLKSKFLPQQKEDKKQQTN